MTGNTFSSPIGGREQLFNLADDPNELSNRVGSESGTVGSLRALAVAACEPPEICEVLDDGILKAFPFEERERNRIYQFDRSRGITGFPERPEDVLKSS